MAYRKDKNYKTNINRENTRQKNKDRVTRTQFNIWDEHRCQELENHSCSNSVTIRLMANKALYAREIHLDLQHLFVNLTVFKFV